MYDTVGGNNSRLALQELLREKPDLRTNKLFSHRLCSVYRRMETQLALRLASKHNKATISAMKRLHGTRCTHACFCLSVSNPSTDLPPVPNCYCCDGIVSIRHSSTVCTAEYLLKLNITGCSV